MLTLITPPASALAVPLEAVKAHLRVAHNDDDVVITALIKAAQTFVGEVTGRAMGQAGWRLAVASVSGDLVLPYPPVSVVTDISIYAPDGTDTVADVADFYLFADDDRAVLRPKSGVWPAVQPRDDAIRVSFSAGYVTAPDDLAMAVIMVVKRDYDGLTGPEAESYDKVIESLVSAKRLCWIAA